MSKRQVANVHISTTEWDGNQLVEEGIDSFQQIIMSDNYSLWLSSRSYISINKYLSTELYAGTWCIHNDTRRLRCWCNRVRVDPIIVVDCILPTQWHSVPEGDQFNIIPVSFNGKKYEFQKHKTFIYLIHPSSELGSQSRWSSWHVVLILKCF